MSQYKPPQRHIPVRVHTSCGWIRGAIHIPEKQSLLDVLNHSKHPFFTLTDVTLPETREHTGFFAVRIDAVSVVVPECEESELQLHHPSTGKYVRHRVSCLLESGSIDGTIGLLQNVRVSDYLIHHGDFHLLRDCVSHGQPDASPLPIVLVNTPRLVGVSELEDNVAPD